MGAAALFQGVCSGHGVGSGSSHHPGLGGGVLPNCPHPSLSPTISPKSVSLMNVTTIWPAAPQLPLTPLVRTVLINGIIPIVDQDILTPHPTPTQHTTTSVGKECFTVRNTPAWWCTIGTAGGREPPVGHSRKLFATCKSVFINGRRAGRFADPLGDYSTAFPCHSTATGASINVFIGLLSG